MWLQHCKINCNLGTLFISRFPRCEREPGCNVVFVPINPLLPSIDLYLDEYLGELLPTSDWEKESNILKPSDLSELTRITSEALEWTEDWHIFNGSMSFTYASYLEKEIEKLF